MVKRIMFILVLLMMFSTVYADNNISLENEDYFNNTVQEMRDGSFLLNPIDIIKGLKNIIIDEIVSSKNLITSMLIASIVSSITYLIQSSFEKKGVSEAAFYACFCMICASGVQYFGIALEYARDVITVMNMFITKLSPLITSMLILSGKVTSAAVFHPVLSTGVYVVALIVENWLIPLITYGAVLSIVNNIGDAVQISGICKLINSISKWILAAIFTIFTGICGIYGFSAPGLDVMGAKTMKFAVGSLVPIVGGFLSETLETVVSGSVMMKGVVGSAGIAAITVMCAVPAVKLGIIIVMLKLTSAITEPFTDKRISKLLSDISSSVMMLFGMVVTVAILFIICISIIMGSTG